MNESSSPAPAPVSPLWTRDFTIITLGSVISMLGNSMSGFALSLLVLDYTGSNLLYAIYIATFTLPQIVMPIFSGAILDRFSRKKTIYTPAVLNAIWSACDHNIALNEEVNSFLWNISIRSVRAAMRGDA